MTPVPRSQPPARRLTFGAYVLLVTVFVPSAFVALAVHEDPGLSALDEVAHLDYLDRAGDASLARMGDIVSSDIAVLARCRDIEVERGLACDSVEIPVGPPEAADGYSYQAQHPPLYYWVSAVGQRVTSVGPGDNFITTGRLTGAFWLSAGTVAFFAALRRLGVGAGTAGAMSVLLAASPGLIHSASKVTNDATSLLAGSAMLLGYVILREDPSGRRLAAVAAVAVAVVLLKPVNVVAVGAIAITALFDLPQRIGWRMAALTASALAATGVGTVLGWQVMVGAMATIDTDVVMDALLEFKAMSDGPPIGQFVFSAAGLLVAYEAGGAVTGSGTAALALIGRYAIMGTAVSAGLRERRSVATLLGLSALLVSVAAGFLFNVQFWASFGLRGGPAARYGLSLLPMLAVPLAVAATKTRRATIAVWILGLTMAVSSAIGIVLNT